MRLKVNVKKGAVGVETLHETKKCSQGTLMTESSKPLDEAVFRFGASVKAKLSGKGISGAPEDQLRAPLETLVTDLAVIALLRPVT